MEKYGFVYIWRDRKHKRYYIGSHWGTETDGYLCSSNWMRDAHKRRPDDFKRRILARGYSDRAALYLEEERWLAMIKPEEIRVRYYNLALGSTTHWTATDNKLSISEKLSKAQRGFMWYTDGVSSFKFREGDEIPEGLVRGKQSSLREYYNLHPEAREKLSKAQSKRYEDPKEHEKTRDVLLKHFENPDAHEVTKRALAKRYSDPRAHEVKRLAMIRHYENPGAHAVTSAAQKKRWAEFRQRKSEVLV